MEDFAALTEVATDPLMPQALTELPAEPTATKNGAEPALLAKASAEPLPDAVPKGTFASEAPRPLTPLPARNEGPHDAPPPPETASEPALPTSAAATTSQRIIARPRAASRPPFLASESLREDLAPREPGQRDFARTLQGAGVTGFVANALVAFDDWLGWLCAALCASLLVLPRLTLGYAARAQLTLALSGVALVALLSARHTLGAGADEALLLAACGLLPAALLFRSWYRAGRVARFGVAGALALAFAWCALTSHRGLLALEFSWQSWLPALAWYVFGILCLLSLLAFMGDETTGGCRAWAIGISCWFGLSAALRWALERSAAEAAGPAPALGSSRGAALGVTEAALAAVFAVALAQACASWFVSRSRVIPRAS